MSDRRAGVILPLFSCPSSRSWGLGEITDVAPMCAWLRAAGLSAWQLLPINEMAPGQQSPYSAISAMAIDPMFIHVPSVPDFSALGGEHALAPEDRAALDFIRRAKHVDYATIRPLKRKALRRSFESFLAHEWSTHTERAAALSDFVNTQAWWIEDYSLFRAIHAREEERPWSKWPEGLAQREPAAIDAARRELVQEVLFYQYLQWIAAEQWRAARTQAAGVLLFGDLPFMVDGDSADVWSRQEQFHLDVTVGAPPDAFSADGQDWGMPLYRWDVLAREDFQWLRERARRCADLFDGFRIDHLVGFYRTYARPCDGSRPYFTPGEEREQLALGEQVLSVFREPGARIIAEDLGPVPDFVRESLARRGVPGLKVLRWERHWHVDGQPFRSPSEYPRQSVAVSGTHDTETQKTWWEKASDEDRRKVSAAIHGDLDDVPYDRVEQMLIEALFAACSDLVLFPIQDVFGWSDRINDPALVADSNWVFRLPWPVDRFDEAADARKTQQRLSMWSRAHGRCGVK
jgi:4-alpha-glucanotransferase